MSVPPLLPPESRNRNRRIAKIIIVVVCSLLLVGAVGVGLLIYYVGTSGITARWITSLVINMSRLRLRFSSYTRRVMADIPSRLPNFASSEAGISSRSQPFATIQRRTEVIITWRFRVAGSANQF